MSTVIQIKRSSSGLAPNTTILAEGELAYSQDSTNNGSNAILYIEAVDNASNPVIHKLGGKYYTDIIDASNSEAIVNVIVKRDATASFSANTITANVFYGNVVGFNSGSANAAVQLQTPRLINLSGDLEGNVLFDGSQDVTIVANVIANTVELGTDTNGDYVANLTPGTGIDITGYVGETANLTVTLADTAVTPGYYGGTTNIPIFNVDQQGRITTAANATISTTLNISGNTGSNALSLINDTLQIKGVAPGIITDVTNNLLTITNTGVTKVESAGHGIVTNVTTGNVTLTFTGVGNVIGTANEIEVTSTGGSNVQIGLPDDVTIGNNLTVSGNLYVIGDVTTVNTAVLTVEDPLVKFGNANPTDGLDIGFYGEYNDGAPKYAGLFRDASDSGIFKLFVGLTADPTTNVINPASYTQAVLQADLKYGNVTNLVNAILVNDGGTGRNTLTANAVLYGDGTNSVGLASGTAGQVLQISTQGQVLFSMLDGGTY
jgi:hypothetical protein